jgi:hypothetical protein
MTITPEHRAAISLNNTGVILLQRRCYRQGIATLHDAVVAMKSASRRINQREDCPKVGPHSSRETPSIDSMIHQAAKRLAKPEPSVDRNAASHYDLQVLSDCENPSVLQEYHHHNLSTTTTPSTTAPTTGFNNNHAFLLRIEALDYEASTEHNFDLQASVILQNFGVAKRVMAGLTDDLRSKHEHHVGAMRVFTSSYSILTNSCERCDNMEETDLQRFVFAATPVLQNLVELSTLLGLDHYGQEYRSRLEDMRNSARDMLKDCSHEGSAAGAA